MPAKSAKQYGLMQAATHGNSSVVPTSVAKEFIHVTPASKRSKFAKALNKGKDMKKKKK